MQAATETEVLQQQLEENLKGGNAPGTVSTAVADPDPDLGLEGAFSWQEQWYPVLTDATDPGRPHAVTLLGKQLVVWRDGSGTWRCFEDMCPHRLAPLSEGRVEPNGNLSCSYHGWQFAGSGACARIPQAEDPKAEATACASARSCVASYPVLEASRLLWVWPDSSPGAAARAAAAPPPPRQPLEGELDAPLQRAGWFMRDLPYGHTILLENLLDPSHLPFSHHGLGPALRRDNGKPIPMQPVGDPAISRDGALTTAGTPSSSSSPQELYNPGHAPTLIMNTASVFRPKDDTGLACELSFRPPCYVRYKYDMGSAYTTTELLAVPTTPGFSRVFVSNGRLPKDDEAADASSESASNDAATQEKKKADRRMNPLALVIMRSLPVWVSHLFTHQIFDGDGIFLRYQEQRLRAGGKRWAKSYYLPTSADRFVALMRTWMDAEAGGGPAYFGADPLAQDMGESAALTREQMLDRYNQHTRHCPECQKGVRQVTAVRNACAAVAGSMLLVLAATAAANSPVTLAARAGMVGLGLFSAFMASKANALLQQFMFVDYVHAERH